MTGLQQFFYKTTADETRRARDQNSHGVRPIVEVISMTGWRIVKPR
jgi:hypothetical protein